VGGRSDLLGLPKHSLQFPPPGQRVLIVGFLLPVEHGGKEGLGGRKGRRERGRELAFLERSHRTSASHHKERRKKGEGGRKVGKRAEEGEKGGREGGREEK